MVVGPNFSSAAALLPAASCRDFPLHDPRDGRGVRGLEPGATAPAEPLEDTPNRCDILRVRRVGDLECVLEFVSDEREDLPLRPPEPVHTDPQ